MNIILTNLNFYLRYVNDILAGFYKEQDSKKHLKIKFTIEKQVYRSTTFLDVFFLGTHNQNLTLQTYQKLTYMGLLLNFESFASF